MRCAPRCAAHATFAVPRAGGAGGACPCALPPPRGSRARDRHAGLDCGLGETGEGAGGVVVPELTLPGGEGRGGVQGACRGERRKKKKKKKKNLGLKFIPDGGEAVSCGDDGEEEEEDDAEGKG